MERSASQKSNDAGMQQPGDLQAQGGWGRVPASSQRAFTNARLLPATPAPRVHIAGDIAHPDFRDALDLLGAAADVGSTNAEPPELIVIAQSRPGLFPIREVEAHYCAAPLAGMIALAGTWCEGELRTGCPWPGVRRLYWYEFPAWWQRQLAIRAAGKCPEWARPVNSELRISDHPSGGARGWRTNLAAPRGTVIVDSPVRETANVLSDLLRRIGYTTHWQRGNRSHGRFRGAIAGIWNGGQLNECEAIQLSTFCRQLSADGAPVVALLDFPRRDRVENANSLGATAVLGKPWLNADLIATLQLAITPAQPRRAA